MDLGVPPAKRGPPSQRPTRSGRLVVHSTNNPSQILFGPASTKELGQLVLAILRIWSQLWKATCVSGICVACCRSSVRISRTVRILEEAKRIEAGNVASGYTGLPWREGGSEIRSGQGRTGNLGGAVGNRTVQAHHTQTWLNDAPPSTPVKQSSSNRASGFRVQFSAPTLYRCDWVAGNKSADVYEQSPASLQGSSSKTRKPASVESLNRTAGSWNLHIPHLATSANKI